VFVNINRNIFYLRETIDIEKEKARLEKEKATAISEIERVEKKLGNESFVAKAPAAVIEGEKQKLAKYTEMLRNIEEMIAKLLK
jgi:valyl-tRNA synthetase